MQRVSPKTLQDLTKDLKQDLMSSYFNKDMGKIFSILLRSYEDLVQDLVGSYFDKNTDKTF